MRWSIEQSIRRHHPSGLTGASRTALKVYFLYPLVMRSIETFAYARSYLKPDHGDCRQDFRLWSLSSWTATTVTREGIWCPSRIHTVANHHWTGYAREPITKNKMSRQSNQISVSKGVLVFLSKRKQTPNTMTPLTIWMHNNNHFFLMTCCPPLAGGLFSIC